MNLLQEIGIQSWRLRGHEPQVPVAKTALESQPAEAGLGSTVTESEQVQVSQKTQESSVTAQQADYAEQASGYNPAAGLLASVEIKTETKKPSPAKPALSDPALQEPVSSGGVNNGAENGTSGGEQSGIEKDASLTAEKSPQTGGIGRQLNDTSGEVKNDSGEIKMPTLRPAPVPLDESPVMDLSMVPPAADHEPPAYADHEIPHDEEDQLNGIDLDLELEAEVKIEKVDPRIAELADLDWRALQARINNHQLCPSCGPEQSVLGFGDVLADWMFVSDAPTSTEVQENSLFLGRAGQLYEAMLAACGLDRQQVYTSTVFKCCPPEDLSLSPQCNKIVHRQIELVQPKVVVALGEFAAQAVLRANEPFEQLQKNPQLYPGTQCMVITSHTLPQLLAEPALKASLWRDLKRALVHAG